MQPRLRGHRQLARAGHYPLLRAYHPKRQHLPDHRPGRRFNHAVTPAPGHHHEVTSPPGGDVIF